MANETDALWAIHNKLVELIAETKKSNEQLIAMNARLYSMEWKLKDIRSSLYSLSYGFNKDTPNIKEEPKKGEDKGDGIDWSKLYSG